MIRATLSIQSTLALLYDQKYRPELLANSPPATHTENERVIAYFSEFLGRPATIDDLSKDALVAYRSWRCEHGSRSGFARKEPRQTPQKISAATVNKDLRVLKALWNFCWDEDIAAVAPRRIKPLREEKHAGDGYSLPDIFRLLATCDEITGTIAGVAARDWWWTLFSASYETGVRKGALMATRFCNINFRTGFIDVRAAEQKTRADQHKDLHPETLAAIDALREPKRELVWPWPHGQTCFYKRIKKILRRTALDHLPRKPMHGLRASHATYLFDKYGMDAARESCGHSSDRVTRTSYIDPKLVTGSRTAAKLPRPRLD